MCLCLRASSFSIPLGRVIQFDHVRPIVGLKLWTLVTRSARTTQCEQAHHQILQVIWRLQIWAWIKNIYPDKWDCFQEGTTSNEIFDCTIDASGSLRTVYSYNQIRGYQVHPSSLPLFPPGPAAGALTPLPWSCASLLKARSFSSLGLWLVRCFVMVNPC